MDYKRLEALTKESKISSIKKKEIVRLLSSDFSNQKNYDELVKWLLKSHYSVSKLFFEQNSFDDEDARQFEKAIEKSEALSKKGKNHFARLWTICATFINKAISKDIISDLAFAIIDYGRDKKQSVVKYSSQLQDEFIKHIVNQNLLSEFLKLPDAGATDFRKKVLAEYIAYISSGNEQSSSGEERNKNVDVVINDDTAKKKSSDAGFDIRQYAEQLTEQLDRLIRLNDTVSMLKTALADKEKEIVQLKQSVKAEQDKTYTAELECSGLKVKLASSESKAEELDARLKQLYETDNSIREQELLTLKKNVADALKMEYSDFKESDDTVNEDNFMANYASLDRIFRILIRFGFDLEG